MKVTLNFLEKIEVCDSAIQAWKDYSFEELNLSDLIEKLKSEKENIAKNYDGKNSLLWCTWLLPYCMENSESVIKYANFCRDLASESAAASAEWEEWMGSAATAEWAAEWAAECAAARAASAECTARWAASAAELAAKDVAAGDKTSQQIIDYGIKLLKVSLQADNK